MSPHTDGWRVIQVYRLVDGAQPGLWDCTAADSRAHWAAVTETYCFGDLKTLLDAVSPATVVTDPAGVARVWNPDALDTPTATVNSGPAAASCAGPASYTGLAAGPHTFQVWPTDAFGNRGPAATWSWSIAG
ncbi:MAG: hypothetical protein ACHQEA_13655 [Gaiellales bacterium]|jgi:hypothetical protein